ncbi:hypothetical protein RDI58_011074 [Solanum bulbocastanum]|uniref:Uncharacterized protein n=1 Tax=Solanum bulbocastanum TaxID=147425 RepID=A0AAN8TWF3_SOLBU
MCKNSICMFGELQTVWQQRYKSESWCKHEFWYKLYPWCSDCWPSI